jgi:predicted nucleotidyltransferase
MWDPTTSRDFFHEAVSSIIRRGGAVANSGIRTVRRLAVEYLERTFPMIELLEQRRGAIDKLCREFHVRKLEVFGSAANGAFDPVKSDLDFLVDFEPMPPGDHARSYFGLLFALEDMFGRKIDLVESRAVTNPYFLRSLECTRIPLYAA